MRAIHGAAGLLSTLLIVPAHGQTNWVDYINETTTRLPTPLNDPALSTTDNSEKSYAFGDVDQDGDLDLVVARRQAYSINPRPNVLFMNEGIAEGHAADGVLVDRTALYASDSDVVGDQGFLTATSDRDVILADLNGDGWLDIVTAVAWAETQPKHLSHPRIYINKGEVKGVWQGFRFENNRISQLNPTFGPRFASVSAGDVTGDGMPDLYFTDFDVSESPMTTDPFDFNNRLLINDGNGFFVDETALRLTAAMSLSAYGAAGAIADMNGDGFNDLVKQSSNLNPLHIAVTYNNPANEGVFNIYDIVYAFPMNAYYVSVGELNNDGKLDLIVTDNNTDRYLLNTGNDVDGSALFQSKQFPFIGFDFGGNSYTADLDRDGFNDVLITDMDVDVPGCTRRMHIYRNLGNTPIVDFSEPSIIPNNMLTGTHDVAVFDINGDQWLDLVIGRCGGTHVWMNVPPPPRPCPADINATAVVDVDDLLELINNWGECETTCPPGCTGDLNRNCTVDVDDLSALINAWGPCPLAGR